jgi:phage tail tape-measure protein
VCDALEIDPKVVRKGLLRWEQTKHATGSKERPQLNSKPSPRSHSRRAQLLSRLVAPAVALAMLITVAGCSGSPLTTREKGTGIGALAGAATGAIIGAAVGAPGAGAAIGGGLGAGGGFLVGNELQNQELRTRHTEAQIGSQQREIEHQRRQIEQLKQQQELE